MRHFSRVRFANYLCASSVPSLLLQIVVSCSRMLCWLHRLLFVQRRFGLVFFVWFGCGTFGFRRGLRDVCSAISCVQFVRCVPSFCALVRHIVEFILVAILQSGLFTCSSLVVKPALQALARKPWLNGLPRACTFSPEPSSPKRCAQKCRPAGGRSLRARVPSMAVRGL